MANQYRQQQQYHQNDRYEERQRHEREDQDRYDYIRHRTQIVNEQFEEVIEERLQEVYDWEIMQIMDQWEQEQLNQLQSIAALEQLFLAQDGLVKSHQIQTLQALEEDEQTLQEQEPPQSVQTQHDDLAIDLSPQSLSSIVYHLEQMQYTDQIHDASDTTEYQLE